MLVAVLEEGLVIQHATDTLRRFGTQAGTLGQHWLSEQERKLGAGQR